MSLNGARKIGAEALGALSLDSEVNHVVGTTAKVLERPANATSLVMVADKGSWRIRSGHFVSQNFTVNAATDELSAASHGYETGDGPFRVSNSGGALPAGLDNATDYYAIKVDDNTIKLANSLDNANKGTAVDITDAGTGTQSITGKGGMPAAADPAAGVTDGTGGIKITEGNGLVVSAPRKVTVLAYAADSVLTYWWV